MEKGLFKDLNNNQKLFFSCSAGSLRYVNEYLKAGADIDYTAFNIYDDSCKVLTTPINQASSRAYFEIVKLLIENGADINSNSDDYKHTPLICASLSGNTEMVKFLVDYGCNVNMTDYFGQSALMLSTYHGYSEIALYLLHNGADTKFKNGNGENVLFYIKERLQATAE